MNKENSLRSLPNGLSDLRKDNEEKMIKLGLKPR
jgi:hypothetical protein